MAKPPPAKWVLGPRTWAPIVGILGVAAVALGLMVALGVNGKTKLHTEIPTCDITQPGCEPRAVTHQHADFLFMVRGQELKFDDPAFISTEGNEKSDVAHLHDPRHTVVHVHREHTTWDDFLRSIGFELNDPSFLGTSSEKTCLKRPDGTSLCNTATETWKFYKNGVKVDGLSNVEIHDLDRVLFSYGPETEAQVMAQIGQISDQACIPSELCHTRIPPGEADNEPCGKGTNSCRPPGR